VQCGSNLRRAGIALYAYTNDYEGRLPASSYTTSLSNYYLPPFWHQVIAPYMGKHNPAQAKGGWPAYPWRFGHIGPDESRVFMPCPSQKTGPVIHPIVGQQDEREQTYNIHYPSVFGFQWIPTPTPTGVHTAFQGSAYIEKVPSEVYLGVDGGAMGSRGHTTYNPGGSGSWALTVDVDFDGVLDSHSGVFVGYPPPFNHIDPVHNRTANFLFADGSTKRLWIKDWAQNINGMWGVGLVDGGLDALNRYNDRSEVRSRKPTTGISGAPARPLRGLTLSRQSHCNSVRPLLVGQMGSRSAHYAYPVAALLYYFTSRRCSASQHQSAPKPEPPPGFPKWV